VELPIVAAIILAAIVALSLVYVRKRGPRLRLMRRYVSARVLLLHPERTAAEDRDIEAIRAECVREWGPLMDPTQPARQRLQYLPPELGMTTAGLDGSEDPADVEVYAEWLLLFIGPGWAAVNPSDWETIRMDFVRHIYDRHSLPYADREADERKALTLGVVRPIALHFFDFPFTQVRYTLPRGGRQASSSSPTRKGHGHLNARNAATLRVIRAHHLEMNCQHCDVAMTPDELEDVLLEEQRTSTAPPCPHCGAPFAVAD